MSLSNVVKVNRQSKGGECSEGGGSNVNSFSRVVIRLQLCCSSGDNHKEDELLLLLMLGVY